MLMPGKRGLVALLALLGVGAAAFAVFGGGAPHAQSSAPRGKALVPVSIAGVPVNNPDKPPSDVAQAGGVLGYALDLGGFQRELEQAGFAFQGLRGFPRTAACMLALSSGQVEVAITGDSPAVLSRARGDKHRAIYLSLPTTETWIVARKGGPRTLAELPGKKVGTYFGSTFDYYFRAATAQLGIEGIDYAQLAPSAALPALQNDSLDAFLTTSTNAALWRSKYGLPVIAKLSEVDAKYRGIQIVSAREDFLAANPGFPAAYFRGLQTAIEAIRKDPEAFFAWEADVTGMPLEIVKVGSPLPLADTPIPPESVAALEEQLAFRLKTGVANAPFDVRGWVVEPAHE
ncbi:MAG: transporter substrate-binding domain-containing protein [Polyangiales bacterium]